jgi:hypothetical protein
MEGIKNKLINHSIHGLTFLTLVKTIKYNFKINIWKLVTEMKYKNLQSLTYSIIEDKH